MKKVAVIMGSDSDFPVVRGALVQLKKFGVPFEARVLSAHRTPAEAEEFAKHAEENGFGVIIAAAGKAAHLGGVLAAQTILPVIGLPIKSSFMDGLDSLLSIVQMPAGIPVATVGVGAADNAGLLAVQMLALSEPELEEKHTSHALAQKAANPFVELKDVTFGYDDHTVLCHLNLQVQTGEQVTLSGRTGAGKSTIFKLLMGLYSPDSGSVTIGGIPADQIPEIEKRKLFGYVEQSFHMVPGTVKDQITLFDDRITMEQVRSAAQLTGLEDTILALPQGYDTPCTQEIFSQGQWQLLSIARAAAAQPELLLLDEITANLDAETEQAVLRALKRVSEHRTVVSISHRVTAETGRIIPIGSASP